MPITALAANERGRKIAAARAATRTRRQNRLTAGEWSLFVFDERNWALHRKGESENDCLYYPDVVLGLQALFRRLLADNCREAEDLREILSAIQEAETKIMAVVTARK